MNELEIMRTRAKEMIGDAGAGPDAIIKAAELLRNAEEIENHRAQTRKLNEEKPESRLLQFMNLLAPVVTVLILVTTLLIQERDRTKDQAQAQKDKIDNRDNENWDRAFKAASDRQEGAQAAAIVLLRGIEESQSQYREEASKLAISILRGAKKYDDFQTLFSAEFAPPTQENLDRILNVDRALHQEWVNRRTDPTFSKSKDEHLIIGELRFICTQIHPLLQKRPPDRRFDLRFVALFDCDLPNVDLTGADLEGFTTARVSMPGANLSGITSISDGYWKDTVWWDAASLSPKLLDYLKKEAPFAADPPGHYGASTKPSQGEYEVALRRLEGKR